MRPQSLKAVFFAAGALKCPFRALSVAGPTQKWPGFHWIGAPYLIVSLSGSAGEGLSRALRKPGGSVGVRVIMAAVLAAALLEGGAGARAADSPKAPWFYTNSESSFANSAVTNGAADTESGLSSVQLLSRFVQNDTSGAPVVFERPLLFGGRDFEIAAPASRPDRTPAEACRLRRRILRNSGTDRCRGRARIAHALPCRFA